MNEMLYVMFIEKTKSYNKITRAVIEDHVENLKQLDDDGNLDRCGVFKGYPGMAGIVILKAGGYEEAEELCKKEPLVTGGYATYSLKAIEVANRENNYLL